MTVADSTIRPMQVLVCVAARPGVQRDWRLTHDAASSYQAKSLLTCLVWGIRMLFRMNDRMDGENCNVIK